MPGDEYAHKSSSVGCASAHVFCLQRCPNRVLKHTLQEPQMTTFRHTNASANRVGEAHSTPRSRSVAMNVSGVNQPLFACDSNAPMIPSTFRRHVPSSSVTYVFGSNGFPS